MSRKITFALLRQIKALFWLRHESFSALDDAEPVPVPVSNGEATIYRPNDERRFPTDL